LSIKQYTLNEIGFFLRAVLLLEERNKKDQFSIAWYGQHLNHKGFTEHMQTLGRLSKQTAKKSRSKAGTVEMDQDEIETEWKRFATAIGGLR